MFDIIAKYSVKLLKFGTGNYSERRGRRLFPTLSLKGWVEKQLQRGQGWDGNDQDQYRAKYHNKSEICHRRMISCVHAALCRCRCWRCMLWSSDCQELPLFFHQDIFRPFSDLRHRKKGRAGKSGWRQTVNIAGIREQVDLVMEGR